MKKIIATVMTVFLLFSVVACENVSDESYVQTEHPTAESSITTAAEETVQATPSGAEEPSLSLLSCRADEDGTYCIDQTTWKSSDDYELFRKYFFGTWEGSFCFPEYPDQKRLVIDDTEKSFVMTETGIRMLGFYEAGVHALGKR